MYETQYEHIHVYAKQSYQVADIYHDMKNVFFT